MPSSLYTSPIPITLERIERHFNNIEISTRVYNFFDKSLDILLKAYKNPRNIIREFISIAIGFELPHPDCYNYIYGLYKDKYKDPIFNEDVPF